MQSRIFTVDVEDFYHILEVKGSPRQEMWDSLSSRVQIGLKRILEMLDEAGVTATFFFLGYIARRHPEIVREVTNLGHEIASHGMYHQLIYQQTQAQFYKDITDSKKLLEDISGQSVIGYRSAGFSARVNTDWMFPLLAKAGYRYDSSIFPALRGHGGIERSRLAPYIIGTDHGNVYEIPVSVIKLLMKRVCLFGGGYLRFFPLSVILWGDRIVTGDKRPVVYYIHPRELDKEHPHLEMSMYRRFKSYYNLDSVPDKLRHILSKGDFITMREYIS